MEIIANTLQIGVIRFINNFMVFRHVDSSTIEEIWREKGKQQKKER